VSLKGFSEVARRVWGAALSGRREGKGREEFHLLSATIHSLLSRDATRLLKVLLRLSTKPGAPSSVSLHSPSPFYGRLPPSAALAVPLHQRSSKGVGNSSQYVLGVHKRALRAEGAKASGFRTVRPHSSLFDRLLLTLPIASASPFATNGFEQHYTVLPS
jgi:hypothetical protein